MPGVADWLAEQVAAAVHRFRGLDLVKPPGVAEAISWAGALRVLGVDTLVCPLHDWSFDLHTGAARQGSCGVAIYPITQDADGTLVLTLD